MNPIQGTKILITGGAGFVGSTTADQLLDAGAAEVRILDNLVRGNMRNLESAKKKGDVVVIEGDIRDTDAVDNAVEGVDYVFHQAALRITRCAEAPREAIQVLIDGTSNVLESAVRHKVKKIVAASSASVYGDPSYLPMDENHPFNNRTLYGAGKIANEQMLRAYYEMFKLPYVAFRYFNIYGPRMDIDGVYTEVLIRWMDAIEAGQPPKIFGDGLQSMDFVYVEDVARANVAGLVADATDEVFNVGMGVETTLNTLCHMLLKVSGSNLKPEYHEARKVNNVRARRATTEKAEKMLGFKANVDLEAGLKLLIEWREQTRSELASAVGGTR
ncbi:NAD-dependent epimerase/dehydratase family protein [Tunturiibacter gelidoferens]|jgi:UDP-glucose 4-epimerase|uniref:UDP-glucose 4-epimerase n=1 Tax=Tunturiibacter gelidiferens TaxID=3069689 RepID=A0A9X0U4Y8_9BACT|nr:NAD-dependent epimerase/dehydratase family protein [Edaphobacter lichenicola]MBB5329976.1 UDP-glucose 4-epimerase [Edaphobacter lichenicola]